jgi:hypothetical protein
MVGISSAETALNMQPSNRLTANLFNGEMLSYWNLWDYKLHDYVFVDGGGVTQYASRRAAVDTLQARGLRSS